MAKILVWRDPSPIAGNDYRVLTWKAIAGGISFITYGGGSAAEVFNEELEWVEEEVFELELDSEIQNLSQSDD